MDISYYYQILDTGIQYEKGRKVGKHWKIGERKRLIKEVLFWQSLFTFIEKEKNGIECADEVFNNLKRLCEQYKLPNYERALGMKNELINSNCVFERKQDEEIIIDKLMKSWVFKRTYDASCNKDWENTSRRV